MVQRWHQDSGPRKRSIEAKIMCQKPHRLKLHAKHLVHTQTLAHAQIQHDLLTSTGDGVGTDITVQTLDLATLATTAVTETTEDLAGLAGAVLEAGGGLGLEAGNGTAELEHGLGFVHALALEDDVLQPVVGGFDLAGHVGQLHTDDRVVDQALAEGLALVGVLHGLFVANTGETDTLDDDADTLVVEVGHDDLESLVLLANQVLHGHLDVLEGNVGGTTAPDTLAIHLAGADAASLTLDKKDAQTVHTGLAGTHSGGEVIRVHTVGDPLLLAVDNVVLAILAELGLAAQVGNITAGIGLSDSQTDALVTGQNAGQNAVDKGLLAELHERWATNTEATDQVPDQATAASAGQLIGEQHLMEEIPVLWSHGLDTVGSVLLLVLATQKTSQVATLTHLLVDVGRDLLSLIPLMDIRLDLALNPLTDLLAESSVCLVEVRRGVLTQ